ncbi:MAG: hypothetical protein EOO73_21260 [Myxococcales bacterium]|nr:MAG: hypothetical protein EOO73_21260 [Myxococcales bacterium]
MKPPVRWLSSGENAPPGAADLLSAAPSPPPFTEAVRYRLAVGVARTAVGPATSAWSAFFAKGAIIAFIGGGSGYVVHALSSKQAAPPPAPVAAQVAASPAAPSLAPPIQVEALPALQLPTAPPPAPKLKLDPRLEEAELLEKARSLVGSSPAAALRLTAEHAREFPKGRLTAEADLLAARALLAMGDAAGAKARAEASLKRYPSGIYARQLREIAAR